MFYYCPKLATIPELDTSNGTNFSYMFYQCYDLKSITKLDTGNGTNFNSMFYYCNKIESIPQLDIDKATSMSDIFVGCYALKELKLLNIRKAITIGFGTTYGHLLTVDSLVNTIKELCKVSTTQTLTIGTANLSKISGLYCKVLDESTEKIDMELCDSTDEGAMSLKNYASLKKWAIK